MTDLCKKDTQSICLAEDEGEIEGRKDMHTIRDAIA